MNEDITFSTPAGFEWDFGNKEKNRQRHQVDTSECEEVFLNKPLLISPDTAHSKTEPRYRALGITNDKRKLFLSFTVRGHQVRIISARDQNRKERKYYETSKS